MKPIEALQITSADDIPLRPIDDIDKIIFGSDDLLAGSSQDLDMIKTAGVRR